MAKIIETWLQSHATSIQQHTKEWDEARKHTVGGSSIAIIQGKNPFCSIGDLMRSRVFGQQESQSNIRIQMGSLMESTLRAYVEYEKKCKILGDRAFLLGKNGTSYSPDGVTEIDGEIVLIELKCPHERALGKSPAPYYVSQVKMGLEFIDIATHGLLIEGEFRKCPMSDLANGGLACGCIFLSANEGVVSCSELLDLGDGDSLAYEPIINLVSSGAIQAHTEAVSMGAQGVDLRAKEADFAERCQKSGQKYVAKLPWRLHSINYHKIAREPGFLTPWMPIIQKINTTVEWCTKEPDIEVKNRLIESLEDTICFGSN
jgi:hypothetical protein